MGRVVTLIIFGEGILFFLTLGVPNKMGRGTVIIGGTVVGSDTK